MIALAGLIPWKYVAIAAAALFVFWFVRDLGVQAERAKWVVSMSEEKERQSIAADVARKHSQQLSSRLLNSEASRDTLTRRLQDEARDAVGAGDVCLNTDSVMRLNAIMDGPKAD